MTRHDPRVRLLHMLDHAREAVAMARVESREGLDEKRWLQLALTKLVEIVGEAAGKPVALLIGLDEEQVALGRSGRFWDLVADGAGSRPTRGRSWSGCSRVAQPKR